MGKTESDIEMAEALDSKIEGWGFDIPKRYNKRTGKIMPEKKCIRYRTIKIGKGKKKRYAHICIRKTKGRRGGRTEITPTGIHRYKLRKVV